VPSSLGFERPPGDEPPPEPPPEEPPQEEPPPDEPQPTDEPPPEGASIADRLATADDIARRFHELRAEAKAAGVSFEKVTGFRDEYDRAIEGQRAAVHEASHRQGRGATAEEVLERGLDRSALRGPGLEDFLRRYRPKWVFRLGRDGREGVRILEHEGNGYFIVRPSKWKNRIRPVAAIERDDTWIQGDLILMAETVDNYRHHLWLEDQKRLQIDAGYREAQKESINRVARESPGGRVFSHRDVAFDDFDQGGEILGPNPRDFPLS
jgi:hypothetical protein